MMTDFNVGTPEGADGALVLEDGRIFFGRRRGDVDATAEGEIVFHTGMTGYPEILTDPSYCGQIVTFTAPHIGNVGMPDGDAESDGAQVSGLIVRRLCAKRSGARKSEDFDQYLKRNNVLCLEGLDTRALTRHIRSSGAIRARVEKLPDSRTRLSAWARECVDRARSQVSMEGLELASRVGATEFRQFSPEAPLRGHVALLHLGAKLSIVDELRRRGCLVSVLPHDTTAEEIIALNADGLLLSNGPGDPAACRQPIAVVRQLLGRIPISGICLGHQILALAAGASSYKLPFGHHGANHPVQELATGSVAITSQNHGFSIDEKSLAGTGFSVSHRSLYDNTVEGVRSHGLRALSVQYHPEAAPGPHDSLKIFDEFLRLWERPNAA